MAKKISEDYQERMSDPSLTWFEKLYGRSEESVKDAMLHVMHEYGVSYIRAEYSGGHDEGGVQELLMYDKDDQEIGLGAFEDEGYRHPVWQACDDLLATKFLSWALGYSVEGYLHVSMGERRAWTEGRKEDWVDDPEPLEVAL